MIPVLFKGNETNFNHNGICLLKDTLSCEVSEGRNGSFDLELVYPITGPYLKDLKNGNIIQAKPNDTDQPHNFRINEIDKTLYDKEVIVYGVSITNDLGGNMVKSLYLEDVTPQVILNKMKNVLHYPTSFNFVSNITTVGTVDWELNNPLNLIVGEEGSLVDIFGGEVKRTNDTLFLYGRRGKDNVTTIRAGKNLDGFKMTESFQGKYTQILPYFKYEAEIPSDIPGDAEGATTRKEVTVFGSIVSSPNHGKYPVNAIKPIDFSQNEFVRESKSLKSLNKEAARYFSDLYSEIDKPSININVDMVQLVDSEQYELYERLEKVELTDTVSVYVPEYDVDILVKITELKYDSLRERTISIVAGSSGRTSLMDEISGSYKQFTTTIVDDKIQSATAGIINQILTQKNGSNMYAGRATPPDNSKPGDIWFKDTGGGDVELYEFDGVNWVRKMYKGFGDDVRQLVDDKIAESNALFTGALDEQAEAVEQANALAQLAKTAASNASLSASAANQDAQQAIARIGNTRTELLGRVSTLDSKAEELTTKATNLQNQADRNTLEITQQAGKIALKAEKTYVDTVKQTVDSHTTSITQQAGQIALKADNTTVNNLTGRVSTAESSITQQAGQIALKANQTELNNLTGRVSTAESSITQQAGQIASKVSQTAFDTEKTKISNLQTSVTQQAGQIALKADNTTVNNLTGRVSTAESTIIAQAGQIDTKVDINQVNSAITVGTQGISQEVSSIRGVLNGGISARNYAVGTAIPSVHSVDSRTATVASGFVVKQLYSTHQNITLRDLGFKVGDKYTVVFDIYANNNTAFRDYRVEGYNTGYSHLVGSVNNTMGTPASPTQFVGTATITSDAHLTTYRWVMRFDLSYFNVTVKNFRIFKGEIKQDWYPAWEDQEAALEATKARVDITDQSITSLVNGVKTLPDGRTSVFATKIESLEGAINQRVTTQELNNKGYQTSADVTKTITDKLAGYVTNQTYTTYTTNRQQTDGQITEQINKTVSKVPTGPVNLIVNGFDPQTLEPWTFSGTGHNLVLATHDFFYKSQKKLYMLYTVNTTEGFAWTNIFNLKRNTKYTLRIGLFATSATKSCDIYFMGKPTGGSFAYNILRTIDNLSATSVVYYTITFDSGSFDLGQFRIDNNGSKTQGTRADLFICEVSCIEGEYNNSWTPSFDELITEQKFNETKSTVDAFSRAIGTRTESGIIPNIASLVMNQNSFVTEVAKYGEHNNNLIVDAVSHSQTIATGGASIVRYPLQNRIDFSRSGATTSVYAGISCKLHVSRFITGETYTLSFDYYLHSAPDDNVFFELKDGGTKLGEGNYFASPTTPTGAWSKHTVTFVSINSSTPDSNNIRLLLYSIKNSSVAIKNIMLVRGDKIGTFSPSQVDNAMTRVEQTANSYSIKFLNGANDITTQLNLTNSGVRIKSSLIHLDGSVTVSGTAWMDGAVIKNLSADKITTGTLNANNVNITNLSVNSVSGITAKYLQSVIGTAFIDWMKGNIIQGYNNNMTIDLLSGNIVLNNGDNAIKRIKGTHTAFVHFNDVSESADGGVGSLYASIGVTSSGDGVNSMSSGRFSGLRAFRGASGTNHNATVDQVEIYGDRFVVKDDFSLNRGFQVRPVNLDRQYELNDDILNPIRFFVKLLLHLNNSGWNWQSSAFLDALLNEWNHYGIGRYGTFRNNTIYKP